MLNIRVALRWKIFLGTMLLTTAIIGLTVVRSHRVAEEAAARHGELATHYRRYDAYQKVMSNDDAAVVSAWAASSTRLIELMGRGDIEGARPLIATMISSLEENLHPDFVVVVDKRADPTLSAAAPLSPDDVRSMRLFGDLHQKAKVRDTLLNHNNRSYVVNGVPLLERDGTNVGAIVIGTRLDRFFAEYKALSDEDSQRQVDLSLINNNGVCTASSARAEDWDDMARAAQQSPRETDREGRSRVEVLRLPGGLHDFFGALRNGYDGALPGTVGTVYVTRSRLDHEARMHQILQDNLAVGAVAIALGLLLSWMLAIGITRPIKRLVAATAEIAHGHGDLTKRIDETLCSSSDELGDLSRNLNAMFANLQHLAGGVQTASLQVGASSAEISAASKQMLSGVKEQALKIESSTAAVTEMSSSIQQVADNALQATKVAKESGDQVQSAIDGMSRIRATVEDAAEKIHDLGESGKRIGSIVEVIRQISEQTTLLALNASIEAAHAGEQGRGFAVVANEVSSLAKRVGQSAKDIEDLIATIKDQTADAVTSMQSGTQEVESGTKIVNHTLGQLKKIVEVIEDTANAVQEQAVVSDEIARNMDAVQKIAQEVLSSSEEAVVQGETLHALAEDLERSVSGFRLEERRDDDPEGAPPGGGHPAGKALPPAERRRSARG